MTADAFAKIDFAGLYHLCFLRSAGQWSGDIRLYQSPRELFPQCSVLAREYEPTPPG